MSPVVTSRVFVPRVASVCRFRLGWWQQKERKEKKKQLLGETYLSRFEGFFLFPFAKTVFAAVVGPSPLEPMANVWRQILWMTISGVDNIKSVRHDIRNLISFIFLYNSRPWRPWHLCIHPDTLLLPADSGHFPALAMLLRQGNVWHFLFRNRRKETMPFSFERRFSICSDLFWQLTQTLVWNDLCVTTTTLLDASKQFVVVERVFQQPSPSITVSHPFTSLSCFLMALHALMAFRASERDKLGAGDISFELLADRGVGRRRRRRRRREESSFENPSTYDRFTFEISFYSFKRRRLRSAAGTNSISIATDVRRTTTI